MRPNKYGSPTIARKKSTVCNSGGAPGNVISAASSGLVRPIATLSLLAGNRRAKTRASGECAAQIVGERRASTDSVDPGFVTAVCEHRRDVAGGKDLRVGAAQG